MEHRRIIPFPVEVPADVTVQLMVNAAILAVMGVFSMAVKGTGFAFPGTGIVGRSAPENGGIQVRAKKEEIKMKLTGKIVSTMIKQDIAMDAHRKIMNSSDEKMKKHYMMFIKIAWVIFFLMIGIGLLGFLLDLLD